MHKNDHTIHHKLVLSYHCPCFPQSTNLGNAYLIRIGLAVVVIPIIGTVVVVRRPSSSLLLLHHVIATIFPVFFELVSIARTRVGSRILS